MEWRFLNTFRMRRPVVSVNENSGDKSLHRANETKSTITVKNPNWPEANRLNQGLTEEINSTSSQSGS